METVKKSGMDWRSTAVCRDEDPELFYPAGDGPLFAEQITEAKDACGACTVTAECLTFAVENHITDGIWGGLTGTERRPLVQAARAAVRPKYAHVATGGPNGAATSAMRKEREATAARMHAEGATVNEIAEATGWSRDFTVRRLRELRRAAA